MHREQSPSSRQIIRKKFRKTLKLPGMVRQRYWQASYLHVTLLSPYPLVLPCFSDHFSLSISLSLVPPLKPHNMPCTFPGCSSFASHSVFCDPGQWTHLVSEVTQGVAPVVPQCGCHLWPMGQALLGQHWQGPGQGLVSLTGIMRLFSLPCASEQLCVYRDKLYIT